MWFHEAGAALSKGWRRLPLVRELRKAAAMESLIQDVRFAFRSFTKQPGFAAIAIATLALGIGANTAIFTVVNAVILEPLPFPAGDRLVRITADLPGLAATDIGVSPPELFDYRDRSGLFDEIAGVYPIDANLTEVDVPERVEVLLVSPSYFSVLGVRPQLGRLFGPEDNHPGIAEVVVISDALWKRRFGGAPDAIGRKLRIDADWYTVIGVASSDFRHPGRSLRTDVEMWAPAGYSAAPFRSPPPRGAYILRGAIGRLKSGLTVAQAQERLDAFANEIRQQYPVDYPARVAWTPRLIPLQQDLVGPVRSTLLTILGAVGIVLLIACANIAGLLLARGAARQRELAVRRALGSGRIRLARLLLTESVALSLCGGALGILLGVWGVDLLLALVPSGLPRISEIAISSRVIAFTFGVSLATGLLFGLAPALQFSNPDVLSALKDGRSPAARSRRVLRASFVVAEFALAMVLLVGAILLLRSFWQVQHVDAGFEGHNVLTARLWLPQPNNPRAGKYFDHAPRLALFTEVMRRVRALPDVESVAMVQSLPLDGLRGGTTITVDGRDLDPAAIPTVQVNLASADYFRLMGIHLLRGRTFSEADDSKGAPIVIVNQELARQYFGSTDPIGQRMHFGGPTNTSPWMTVVGVVGNVLSDRLEQAPRPMLYRPLTQASSLSMAIAIRSTGDPRRLAEPLARAVRAADPDQPTHSVRSMKEVLAAATASRRFSIQLVGGFAFLALLLAAIGIYGVMAYLVNQRTREIGIRMALGARPGSVVRLVVSYALGLAAGGVLLGIVGAAFLTRLISGMLFGVSPSDPVTFTVIALTLLATALVATVTPARRAARVDPMIALRAE
jgi:putative ABC transport system permease protein